MQPNPKIVFMVVGTLAMAVVIYCGTLSFCAIMGIEPSPKVLEYLKDIGLLCAGAISGILSRTGATPDASNPQPVTIQQPANNPVPVDQAP